MFREHPFFIDFVTLNLPFHLSNSFITYLFFIFLCAATSATVFSPIFFYWLRFHSKLPFRSSLFNKYSREDVNRFLGVSGSTLVRVRTAGLQRLMLTEEHNSFFIASYM